MTVRSGICGALVLAALAIAAFPVAAAAQSRPGGARNVRGFGGFSYLRLTASGNDEVAMLRENTFGLKGTVTYYVHDKLGVVIDAGFNAGSIVPDEVPAGIDAADLTQTTLTIGPSFIISNDGRVVVNAFATFGWAVASIAVTGTNENALPVFRRFDDTTFAATIGASFDYMLDDDWGVRIAQLEVLLTSFGETLSNFRYAGGIVATF